MVEPFDAVILAGGAARRLGGVDKAALVVGGRTLLDHVVDTCRGADRVAVVGPRRPIALAREILWSREEPPGGGPVAAIAAGLREADCPLVAVLACDLPYLMTSAIDGLREQASTHPEHDGAIFVDSDGRDQPLVGVYRRASLVRALSAFTPSYAGAALRGLLEGLNLLRIPDEAGVTRDCDTWHEVEVARGDR